MTTLRQLLIGISNSVRRMSWVEWGVTLSMVVVLIALLAPRPRWCATGRIEFPVQVIVFDARTGNGIAGVRFALLRASPVQGADAPLNIDVQFPNLTYDTGNKRQPAGITNSDGWAMVNYEFRTGASHNHPVLRAQTDWVWVAVDAEGYGPVVIPLRHDPTEVKQLRQQKSLQFSVGLYKD